MRRVFIACVMLLSPWLLAAEQTTKVLFDFETEEDIRPYRPFEIKNGSGKLVSDHATSGQKALQIAANEYMIAWWNGQNQAQDWSGFDSLDFDVYNDTDKPIQVSFLIGDEPWQKNGGDYWDRYNDTKTVPPGQSTVSLPVDGLFRGEVGSRNNHLKMNIDPKCIIRLDIGFQGPATAKLYIDNMRLTKTTVPDWIRLFDFGPESQMLYPGATPVSWTNIYSVDKKFGWHPQRRPWSANNARDDSFPTILYRDCVECSGCEFMVDVPNGKWHGMAVFEDSGQWGGEQAKHTKRTISAEGNVVYTDDRGEKGPFDFLYHFEDVEPTPGCSLWELYMDYLCMPRRFEAEVTDGQLNLQFYSDGGWSTKISCLVLYPEDKKAEGEKFVDNLISANRKEFEKEAVESATPAKEKLPAGAEGKGYVVFLPDYTEDIFMNTLPEDDAVKRSVEIAAALGEYEPFIVAIRPVGKDLGTAKLEMSPLTGSNGAVINDVNVGVVWHGTSRTFNTIAFNIVPKTVRSIDWAPVILKKDITRTFWITCHAPKNAVPGDYSGTLTISSDKGLNEKIDVKLKVRPFALDESDYFFGFFGLDVPGVYGSQRQEKFKELFKLMRNHGMSSFSGGPDIPFSGFKDGKPQLDFSNIDTFLADARDAGFTKTLCGYGSLMVSNVWGPNYAIGDNGKKLCEAAGKPFPDGYPDALKIVLDEVKKHAQEKKWQPILYSLCDEPRSAETSRDIADLIRAINKASDWVITSGSYSVDFNPNNKDSYQIQDIFKELRVSSLNSHDDFVMQKAKELNKKIMIYNQGTDRYSFGLYQWSEYTKGVIGRIQWHLLALHGYQFFDLDGREPDTAMINFHSKGIIPTVNFERCREGADDFYYFQTLSNRVTEARKAGVAKPECDAAESLMKSYADRIKIGENIKPKNLDENKMRNEVAAMIEKIMKATGAAKPSAGSAAPSQPQETASTSSKTASTTEPDSKTSGKKEEPSSKSNNTLVIIAVAVGILLIIGIVAYLVMRSKAAQQSKPETRGSRREGRRPRE